MKKLICMMFVMLFVLCSCSSAGADSYQEAVDNLAAYLYGGDVSCVEKLSPPFFWEFFEKEATLSVDEIKDSVKGVYEDYFNNMKENYGEDFEHSHKIISAKKLKGKEFEECRSEIKSKGQQFQMPKGYEIDEIMEIEISVTFKGSKKEISSPYDFLAVKTEDGWYVYFDNVGFAGAAAIYGYSAGKSE